MKKSTKTLLIGLGVIACLLCTAVQWVGLWGFCTLIRTFGTAGVVCTDDLYDYQSGAYKEFHGGEAASEFLPAYTSLSDACAIDFHYFDGTGKSTFFRQFYITFALDVQYCPEQYESYKNSALQSGFVYETEAGEYRICVEKNESDTPGVSCICYNDTRHILRYILLVGTTYEECVDIYTILILNSNIAW